MSLAVRVIPCLDVDAGRVVKGVHFEMSVTVYGQEWLIHSTQSQEVGSVIEIRLDPEDLHIMKKMEE